MMTLFMTSKFKNLFENDVITTDMIHLLDHYSTRHTQQFSFLNKSIGPILPFFRSQFTPISFTPSYTQDKWIIVKMFAWRPYKEVCHSGATGFPGVGIRGRGPGLQIGDNLRRFPAEAQSIPPLYPR